MNVLITGSFGNIGESAMKEMVKQGHKVRCFDIKTKANEKVAKKYKKDVEVVWGDIRRYKDVAAAVQGQDAVLHLAFVIASDTSVTGRSSEDDPAWSREINVGGTQNVLKAMEAQPNRPKMIFPSSITVYGKTQSSPPPRKITDPLVPTTNYNKHKIECEQLVQASGVPWVILRLGVASPLRKVMSADMFDPPLNNRLEYVHTWDVGLACANAVTSDECVGKVLHIGGGPKCQITYGDLMHRMLTAMGLGMLPEKAWGTEEFYMDWMDTTESQRLLKYQRYCVDDYVDQMKDIIGYQRYLARIFRPIGRWYLLSKSPYYKAK